MTAPTSARSRVWPEHWAIFASAEADSIEYEARVARPAKLGVASSASMDAITGHLAEVRAACRRPTRRLVRQRGVIDRWRGASVERAFRHLHAAKVFLVDVLPQAEADALIPDVLARTASVLDRNDPRRTLAERALRSPHPGVRRAALRQAMDTAYEASDEEYARLRDFRNIIVLTTIGLALFVGGLIAAVNLTPKAIPLCFQPAVTAAASTEPAQATVCPSGDHHSSGGDVLVIAGLGAVGGGLGALFTIRNLRGTSTPYGIPTALALLKVPAGALTAVIGILIVAGGFVPGLSNLDSQQQILAYALLFGYAQQLITRLVDNQGQNLLNKVPSKDSEAEQPPPEAPPPPPAAPVPVDEGVEAVPAPESSTEQAPDAAGPPGDMGDVSPETTDADAANTDELVEATDTDAAAIPEQAAAPETAPGS